MSQIFLSALEVYFFFNVLTKLSRWHKKMIEMHMNKMQNTLGNNNGTIGVRNDRLARSLVPHYQASGRGIKDLTALR